MVTKFGINDRLILELLSVKYEKGLTTLREFIHVFVKSTPEASKSRKANKIVLLWIISCLTQTPEDIAIKFCTYIGQILAIIAVKNEGNWMQFIRVIQSFLMQSSGVAVHVRELCKSLVTLKPMNL